MYASPLGAHGGTRTPDPRIKNPLLYQLSYMSVWWSRSAVVPTPMVSDLPRVTYSPSTKDRKEGAVLRSPLEEPEGFEPSHGVCTAYSLSRGAPLTSWV